MLKRLLLLTAIIVGFVQCGFADLTPLTADSSGTVNAALLGDNLLSLSQGKLDLRPGDVLPRVDVRYTLGDSNYRWLGLFATSATITNLYGVSELSLSYLTVTGTATIASLTATTITATAVTATSITGSTLTFSSATITQLSVSSLTLTNLNSLFKLAVGTFTSSGSTGNQSVTGVGFRPRFIALAMGAGGTDTTGYTAFGWATASKQAAAFGFRSDDSNSGGLATNASTVIRWADTAGNAVGQASLSSMDSDGFTLNWTAANAQTITYFAIQ